ncbi:MAG: phenylalanine--tRNA ligase subunit beta [Candidatus Diapherotrites archaeon]|nr:phenylalanine--tRNA ligase subunit beta [Candidatus Diapherotrites archaeon]
MPVIELNRTEVSKFVGRNVSIKELEDRVPMLGTEWEENQGDDFTVEVFPNRPDLLSLEGFSRALAGFIGEKTGPVKYKVEKSNMKVSVDANTKDVREFIACAAVKNIEMSDEFIKSIMQIQEKLHITHGRNRSKVAIGIHNLDTISFPLTYKAVKRDFSFVPLETAKKMTADEILTKTPKGTEYAHILESGKLVPMIIDSTGQVLSFPPIINSEHTKITPDTKNLFVEITGTNKTAVDQALNMVVTAFFERNATLVETTVGKETFPNLKYRKMNLSLKYINKMLGTTLDIKESARLLEKMRFEATVENPQTLSVGVPPYRTDVMHAIDLVEDIAIAFGIENFDPEIPNVQGIGQEKELEIFSRKLRQAIIGFGCQETITFILSNKELLFEKMNSPESKVVEIENPLTVDYCVCRNTLAPSLMDVLSRNKHNKYPQKIFEVADCMVPEQNGGRTTRKCTVLIAESKADFSCIKSVAESIFHLFRLEAKLEKTSNPTFINGRAVNILLNGKTIGVMGEVHPEVLENFEIEMPVALIEFDAEELLPAGKQGNS